VPATSGMKLNSKPYTASAFYAPPAPARTEYYELALVRRSGNAFSTTLLCNFPVPANLLEHDNGSVSA